MGKTWYPKSPAMEKLWKLLRGKLDRKLQIQIGILLTVFVVVLIVLCTVGLSGNGGSERQKLSPIQGNKYNPSEEGELVEVSGPVVIKKPITDPVTGLKIFAVVLSRNSAMYQWEQRSKTIDSEHETKILPYAAYSYIKKWSSKPISSASFPNPEKHFNPSMLIKGHKYINSEVYIGDYKISPKILNRLIASKKIILDEKIKQNIKTDKGKTILDGILYIGNDIYSPVVGDYIISYKMSIPTNLTVVGIQKGREIVPSEEAKKGKSFFIKEL